MAGSTVPYREFTEREKEKKKKLPGKNDTPVSRGGGKLPTDKSRSVPRLPGYSPPGSPDPRQGTVDSDPRKEALKRRLIKRTAAAMKAKSQRRN